MNFSKVIFYVLFLFNTTSILSQNKINIKFYPKNDSIFLGEDLIYNIHIENDDVNTLWIANIDKNIGADLSLLLNSSYKTLLNSAKPFHDFSSDDGYRLYYYEIKGLSKYISEDYHYNLFYNNKNLIDNFNINDNIEIKFKYETRYTIPSLELVNAIKHMGSEIVYFENEEKDTLLRYNSIQFSKSKIFHIKYFNPKDEKAYNWLKKKNLFWVLFQPYDEKINYSGLKSFIKKFPSSCLTLKAQKVYADIIYQKKEREAIKLYTNILSSSNNDIYGVKNPSAQMLKYIQDSKERENEIDLYKKQLKNKKNTQ